VRPSREALNQHALDVSAGVSELLAGFIVALGEYASGGDLERSRELLDRVRRDVIQAANEYASALEFEE
jgi:hypothetical protein